MARIPARAKIISKKPFVVKSAGRILELLEYVADVPAGVTLADIVRKFGYPLSSASALLKSLSALGYLYFNRQRHTYHATARVALLGSRTMPLMFGERQIQKAMEAINRETGHLVNLAMRIDTNIRLIYGIDGSHDIRLDFKTRGMRSWATTCSGRLFLSTLSDAQIRATLHRFNAENKAPEDRVNIDQLIKDIRKIRDQGYSMLPSKNLPGVAGLAVLIPQTSNTTQLAIVVSAFVDDIVTNQLKYAQIIRDALENNLDMECLLKEVAVEHA